MTFVGIRYRTTSGIRIRGVIGMGIIDRRIRVVGTRGIIPVAGGLVAGLVTVVGIIIRRVVMDAMDVTDAMGNTRRGVV